MFTIEINRKKHESICVILFKFRLPLHSYTTVYYLFHKDTKYYFTMDNFKN